MNKPEYYPTLKVFKALSDETRLRTYLLLSLGDLCVCELIYILGYEQSRVSHCLRILRDSELVVSSRNGKIIIYSINPEYKKNKILQYLNGEFQISESDKNMFLKCKKEKIRQQFIAKQKE